MTLQAVYEQFLANPSTANLAADATLYYITTTTVVHGDTEIIKHLSSVRKQIKTISEVVLSTVASRDCLVVELDTTLEFLTGGAAYLPGVDNNFLIDRKVNLPIIHFVSFNASGKITQIRQSWDQGALLKQVEVIGKSGRNWPIRESAEQIKLITRAVSVAYDGAVVDDSSAPVTPLRSRGNSVNPMRDPHASLELFAAPGEDGGKPASVIAPYGGVRPRQRDVTEILSDEPPADDATPRAVISPYAGRRPRERSFSEILGDEDIDGSVDGSSSAYQSRSQSPSKYVAPKIGTNKKFQPVRLFEADEAAAAAMDANAQNSTKSPERRLRPDPKKYNHFDFVDGSDPKDAPKAGVAFDSIKSKHNSQWSFEGFTTPQKPSSDKLPRGQEVRHFSVQNDDVPETPHTAALRPAPPRPRPDAEPHFEFRDDGEPIHGTRQASRPRGSGQNQGMGLYENNLYKEDGSAPTPAKRALGNITNLKDRTKFFEPHFAMADVAPPSPANGNSHSKTATISDDRKKAVKMMESNWGASFEDGVDGQKENAYIPGTSLQMKAADQRGITIGGDGMGGKKEGRSWSFGGVDDEDAVAAVPGKKQGTANQASSFWDF